MRILYKDIKCELRNCRASAEGGADGDITGRKPCHSTPCPIKIQDYSAFPPSPAQFMNKKNVAEFALMQHKEQKA